MPSRICPECRRINTGGGRRHKGLCQQAYDARRNAASPHQDSRWRALSRRLLAAWRAVHGDWCPGDENHLPHACTDLTVDHIKQVSQGGELLDPANTRINCRSANSARR